MKLKNRSLITITLIIWVFLLFFSASAFSSTFKIIGKRANVDLSDLLGGDEKKYSEIEIRKVCAAITERYHSLGYTGFYIKSAIIKKDSSVELFFIDPVVESVKIHGKGIINDSEIAAEIYIQGGIFNEFILKDNLKSVKKRYSIKRVKIELNRTPEGNITVIVNAEKNFWSGDISIYSEPVYGPSCSAAFTFDIRSAEISLFMESSSGINDAGYRKAGLAYSLNFPGNETGLFFSINYTSSDDAVDDRGEYFYSSEIEEVNGAIRIRDKPLEVSLILLSSFATYGNYPAEDGGLVFSGASVDFRYNDKFLRIDPLDAVSAGLNCDVGWNNIESETAVRIKFNGDFAIPLCTFCSLSVEVYSDFTSEDMRLFHPYVFDRVLPCRSGNYTTSTWRTIGRSGLLFGIYSRKFYISPEYIYGLYDKDTGTDSVSAAGVKALINSDSFKAEVSYILENGKNLKEGIFNFSAKADF